MNAHRHRWVFGDNGVHWCRAERDCALASDERLHDFPCDRPQDHEGETEPPPGHLELIPRVDLYDPLRAVDRPEGPSKP